MATTNFKNIADYAGKNFEIIKNLGVSTERLLRHRLEKYHDNDLWSHFGTPYILETDYQHLMIKFKNGRVVHVVKVIETREVEI